MCSSSSAMKWKGLPRPMKRGLIYMSWFCSKHILLKDRIGLLQSVHKSLVSGPCKGTSKLTPNRGDLKDCVGLLQSVHKHCSNCSKLVYPKDRVGFASVCSKQSIELVHSSGLCKGYQEECMRRPWWKRESLWVSGRYLTSLHFT